MTGERTHCNMSSGNLGQKSFKIIRDAVEDALMPVKMAAFKSMAKQLQPFLAIFQSDNPLLPFMASTLEKMIVGLMKRYV